MWLQFLVIFLGLLGLSFFGSPVDDKNIKGRLYYIRFIWLILVLQSCLRNVAVGADTFEYSRRFSYYSTLSWDNIWQSFLDSIFNNEGKEIGYTAFNKLISVFTDEFQWLLVVVAIIFFTVLCNFIYNNTKNTISVFFSLCLYQMLFYGFFSITGIRQTLAVAFVLWGFRFIKNRKIIYFLLTVLFASLFHKTALIALPFYYLARIKSVKTTLVIALICLPILLLFAREFAFLLADVVGDYATYAESTFKGAGGPNYLILLLILVILTFLKYRNLINMKDINVIPYINALAITVVLAPLVWVDPSFIRLSYYYSITLIALFPNLISFMYDPKESNSVFTITAIIILFTSLILFTQNSSYRFFWEEMRLPPNYKNVIYYPR